MLTPAVRRAALTQQWEARHAAHARVAGTRLCVLSRRACNWHCFAHFLHQDAILRAFSVQNRPGTDRDRILPRESMPISCHENRGKSFKVRPIWPKQAFRYPIDTLPIPDFREIRGRLAPQQDAPGLILDKVSPIFAHLRSATDKETDATEDFDPDCRTRRRCGPRRGSQLANKSRMPHARHHPFRGRNPRLAAYGTGGHLLVPRWRQGHSRAPRTTATPGREQKPCLASLSPDKGCTRHSRCNNAAQRIRGAGQHQTRNPTT